MPEESMAKVLEDLFNKILEHEVDVLYNADEIRQLDADALMSTLADVGNKLIENGRVRAPVIAINARLKAEADMLKELKSLLQSALRTARDA